MTAAPTIASLALDHLLLRLRPINRALQAAAQARAGATARLMRPDGQPASITDQHLTQLFLDVDHAAGSAPEAQGRLALNEEEAALEQSLRKVAARTGSALPLDALQQALDLTEFEIDAVLLCAAPQLHGAYHRIYAFIHDDLNRLGPSVELLARLEATGLADQVDRREALAPEGKLCRLGLLQIVADPPNPLHREFALDSSAFDALTGGVADWRAWFRDAELVAADEALPLKLFPDGKALGRIARLLKGDQPCFVGLWGRGNRGGADVAVALAAASGRMLRRLPAGATDEAVLHRSLKAARALGALVWIDSDRLPAEEEDSSGSRDRLVDALARFAPAVICTGVEPWRPLELIAERALIDLSLEAPDLGQRTRLWQAVVPEASPETSRLLAARYRFSPREMRAAASMARLESGDGDAMLPRACRAVSMRRASAFAKVVVPRRGPDDLVLPAELHRRVTDVAAFYRALPRVDETWGFGRMLSGGGGVKVLMTGDSGTGKTAAAEVIAGLVDPDQLLLKVHLASVVSKWVGVTEKNLDAVFEHAEESHAVLFFDEADALFAKRGEVERGSDRYANVEVSFLLQRLEDFGGLVICASNHKDQIDEAFMRRFQVVLHFPRPSPTERRRLWELALPDEAPKAADVDLEALVPLDLTGAGIVNAARMAALLAAQNAQPAIGMAHLIPAVVRQFQHEGRLLPVAQLGRFAPLAGPAP